MRQENSFIDNLLRLSYYQYYRYFNKYFSFAWFMKLQTKSSFLVLFSLLIFSWQFVDVRQVKAQRMRSIPLSEEELKLREELEQDTSIIQIPCRLPYRENPDQKYLEMRKLINETKLSLYKAASSKEGIVKAKKICNSIEGKKYPFYLLVNKGKITFIADSSRDPLYSTGRIHSITCDSLMLGKNVEIGKAPGIEFQSVTETVKDKVTFMLRCETKERNTEISVSDLPF